MTDLGDEYNKFKSSWPREQEIKKEKKVIPAWKREEKRLKEIVRRRNLSSLREKTLHPTQYAIKEYLKKKAKSNLMRIIKGKPLGNKPFMSRVPAPTRVPIKIQQAPDEGLFHSETILGGSQGNRTQGFLNKPSNPFKLRSDFI